MQPKFYAQHTFPNGNVTVLFQSWKPDDWLGVLLVARQVDFHEVAWSYEVWLGDECIGWISRDESGSFIAWKAGNRLHEGFIGLAQATELCLVAHLKEATS